MVWRGEFFRLSPARKEESCMSKRSQTPSFLLELPLQVNSQQAKHLRAHFEAARCLYNALLDEAMKRLRLMRSDPRWQEAQKAADKQERNALFSQLRQEYAFSEYALHAYSTGARTTWIAEHLDSNTAQKLASRAYQAANRVCLGQARRVRFKSCGRGPDSVEGKSNKSGLRFVLQAPKEGNAGWLMWQHDRLSACSELKTGKQQKRRLQRRANNQENYDHKGRVKKGRLRWKDSQGYKTTLRRLATQERKLAAHRKSLHGHLVHEIVAYGITITTEKLSYKAWQKQYGKSVGTHAPSMFIDMLKRTVARTGGILHKVSTHSSKLSQYCHGCHSYVKKKLSERWHQCPCGIGPVQRDLYSAFLAAYLDPRTLVPSIAQDSWESAETRLRAAIEDVQQRANAGQMVPQSFGIPRAGARLPRSLVSDHQELLCRVDRGEAVARGQEPLSFKRGSLSYW